MQLNLTLVILNFCITSDGTSVTVYESFLLSMNVPKYTLS